MDIPIILLTALFKLLLRHLEIVNIRHVVFKNRYIATNVTPTWVKFDKRKSTMTHKFHTCKSNTPSDRQM